MTIALGFNPSKPEAGGLLGNPNYRKALKSLDRKRGSILPTDVSVIHYDRRIPRYCLFVDNVEVIRPSSEEELWATAAIMFTPPPRYWDKGLNFAEDENFVHFSKLWSFCSFRPGSDKRSLEMAIDWLKDYAARYSEMDNPPILNDFDEHYEHFDNPIEFPIRRLFGNDFNINLLLKYEEIHNFTINAEQIEEINMGKIYKNIRNSTIVDDSIVIKSFNEIQRNFGQDTAKALLRVAEEIAKSHNKEASELFMAFNKELQKPEPSRSVLKTHWDGIVKALPYLVQLADVVKEISKLFAAWLLKKKIRALSREEFIYIYI